MLFSRVLVCTDFRPASDAAARFAAVLCGPDAHYRMVHVLTRMQDAVLAPFLDGAARAVVDRADRQAVVQAMDSLHSSARGIPDVPIEPKLLHGSVGPAVAEAARQWNADLVVIGDEIHTKRGQVTMGARARSVLQAVDCPTLIVRSAPQDAPSISTVLVASDFGAHSHAAAAVGSKVAAEHGASVVLLHAVDPEVWWSTSAAEAAVAPGEALPAVHSGVEGVLRQMLQDFNSKHFGEMAQGVLRPGRPTQAVLDAVNAHAVDLIIVGSHGHGRLVERLLGSVSHALAERSPVPVLVVRGTHPDPAIKPSS